MMNHGIMIAQHIPARQASPGNQDQMGNIMGGAGQMAGVPARPGGPGNVGNMNAFHVSVAKKYLPLLEL